MNNGEIEWRRRVRSRELFADCKSTSRQVAITPSASTLLCTRLSSQNMDERESYMAFENRIFDIFTAFIRVLSIWQGVQSFRDRI
jgi:hypothetical protein